MRRCRRAAAAIPGRVREAGLRLALGTEYQALQNGRFRSSGEVHRWMYDELSLAEALRDAGFASIVRRTATESYLKEWATFELDADAAGAPYKPDSLYMEARKEV